MAPVPSSRCPPITLIREREVVLSVAGRWVAAVYAVHHLPSDPPGPRFMGRDVSDTHRVSSLSIVGQHMAPGVFQGLVLELGAGELAWTVRTPPLPGKKSENSVRGELSGSPGGSCGSDAVRVSGVSWWGPDEPDLAVPPLPEEIGDPGGEGPFPSDPWSSAVDSLGDAGIRAALQACRAPLPPRRGGSLLPRPSRAGSHSRWSIGQSLPIRSGTGWCGTIPARAVNTPCGVRTSTWQVL